MKTKRQKLIIKLDKLFSEKIRAKGFCEKCGKSDRTLQCAHIYSRSNKSIRWDFENAVCLCGGCHIFWAHKEPVEFTRWVNTFKNLDYLEEKKAKTVPIKIAELEAKLEELKNRQ